MALFRKIKVLLITHSYYKILRNIITYEKKMKQGNYTHIINIRRVSFSYDLLLFTTELN